MCLLKIDMDFFTPQELSAISLSLKVSLRSLLLIAFPGIFTGWMLARCEFRGKWILNAFVHLPMVLPPVVVGYLLLELFGRYGLIGKPLGLKLAFTASGAALASAVMGFPLLVRAVRIALEQTDHRLEDASLTLGAGRIYTFFHVTLPLAAPGVTGGLLLAFARSLGEFGATVTFAGNIAGQTRTLSLAIFTALQSPGGEKGAFRLAAASIFISLFSLALSEYMSSRKKRTIS